MVTARCHVAVQRKNVCVRECEFAECGVVCEVWQDQMKICNVILPWLCAPEPPVSSATRSHVRLGWLWPRHGCYGILAAFFSCAEKISFSFIILFLSFWFFVFVFWFYLLSVNARWCSLCRSPLSIIFVASLFARCIATNHRRHHPLPPHCLHCSQSFGCSFSGWNSVENLFDVVITSTVNHAARSLFRYPNLFPHRPELLRSVRVFGMLYDAKTKRN